MAGCLIGAADSTLLPPLPTTACSQQALQRHDDGDTGNHDAAQADREPERLVFDRLL